MKKIVSLILLAAMLVTSVLATSCGGNKTPDGGSDIKMDIDLSQKPTLSVLMPNSGKSIDAVNSDPTALLIEELTGYKTEYTQLPADATSTLNSILMDKEQYDVMKLTKDQFSDLVEQDMLLELPKSVLEKFAPDMLANISKESWDVVTVDGKIYGIPERASSDNIENPIVLNYDIMLELGLDVPETLDEFTAVLRAITNHLGKPALTFDKFTPLVYAISAAFGIYSYWQEYDGEVLFYMNAPRYNEYVEYMHSLYAEGLIDVEVATNTAADATNRFVNSFDANSGGAKAGVYACSLWTVSAIVTGLNAKGINTDGELTNELAYIRSLKENAADEEKVYRSSGYTYITAIPYYMAENAGYALDWMNSKIKDTATEDNFRQIVLGKENVHWTNTSDGGYMPINPAFAEKDTASYYMTGSNETKYTAYWLARVRKQPELYRAWSELMDGADEVGVYNVVDFTPPIAAYTSNRSAIETNAQDWFYMMLKDGTSKLAEYQSKLNGQYKCSDATTAINAWYK